MGSGALTTSAADVVRRAEEESAHVQLSALANAILSGEGPFADDG